jgi:hypothetical protein
MAWLNISLETANKFYAWGWRGSILGAVIAAIAVIFLMWGTRVRDEDSERHAVLAGQRATALERSIKESAQDQDKLRAANDSLQRELKELKQPRTISNEAAAQMISSLRSAGAHSIQIVYVAMDPDAESLASSLNNIFQRAGWNLLGRVQPQIDTTRPPRVGLVFGVKSQQQTPQVLVQIIDVLRDQKLVGARAFVGLAPELPDNQSIAILVGRKPL